MTNKPLIYLDYAAATPVDERVVAAMSPYFSEEFYNPSAVYLAAAQTKDALEGARENIAHWLGARPSEITFTAGATEANNLAIHGVMSGQSGEVLISAIEHDSVLVTAEQYRAKFTGVDNKGRVDLEDLRAKITPNTRLVSIIYANNEIGTVQSLRAIADTIQEERRARKKSGNKTPIHLHTDASQAANYLDLHVDKLKVDMMTLNGGKTYGPKQSGALYVRAGITLSTLVAGGGQEHGLRSGTENVAFAVGLATALSVAQKMRHDEQRRVRELAQHLSSSIEKQVEGVEVLGHKKQRLPNIVAVRFDDIDGERALMALDQEGIMVGTGSACSALSEQSSHVIKALGLSEREARGTLRISLGRQTSQDDIDMLLNKLPGIIAETRELSS